MRLDKKLLILVLTSSALLWMTFKGILKLAALPFSIQSLCGMVLIMTLVIFFDIMALKITAGRSLVPMTLKNDLKSIYRIMQTDGIILLLWLPSLFLTKLAGPDDLLLTGILALFCGAFCIVLSFFNRFQIIADKTGIPILRILKNSVLGALVHRKPLFWVTGYLPIILLIWISNLNSGLKLGLISFISGFLVSASYMDISNPTGEKS